MKHLPVLFDEVMQAFKDQTKVPDRILDGTFGRGGHTEGLLQSFPSLQIAAFDKDPDAVKMALGDFTEKFKKRFQIVHDDFKNLAEHELGFFDGALFDLGISSPQIDVADRGFSFMNDGPLDMRMNTADQSLSAKEIINEWEEKELSDLFFHTGEIKKPNRVVRAIVNDRKTKPFETTRQLASLIERVDGYKSKGHHPATNYFLALRLVVNGELEGLETFLKTIPQHMSHGARVCVISFHSTEDRIVKNAFKELADKKFGSIINKRVIVGSDAEVKSNPRSRSAKLRIFEIGTLIDKSRKNKYAQE